MKKSSVWLTKFMLIAQVLTLGLQADGDKRGDRDRDRGSSRGGDRGGSRGGDRGGDRGGGRGGDRGGGDRGSNRPSGGDRGSSRPSGGDRGGSRPAGGDRGSNRPSGGDRGSSRPSGGDRSGNRPSVEQRGGGNRPGNRDGQRGGRERSIQRAPSMGHVIRSNEGRGARRWQGNNQSRPSMPDRQQPTGNRDGRQDRNDRRSSSGVKRDQVRQWIKSNPNRYGKGFGGNQHASNKDRSHDHRGGDSHRYRNVGKNVRDNINRKYGNRRQWFSNDFWHQHRRYPRYYNRPLNWWGGATAVGIGSWLGWRATPYYYNDYADYGDSSVDWTPTLYYAQETTYVPTTTQYQLADVNEEWMPLGVFAIIRDGESVESSNMFMQLAVSRDGTIAGVFYNAATNEVYDIDGAVDEASQMAVWEITNGDSSPKIETGIYNLTQEEAPARVYFPSGIAQNRLLIRLEGE